MTSCSAKTKTSLFHTTLSKISESSVLAKEKLQIVLSAKSENAKLQRSALFALSVRVLSAGLAYLSQVLLARMLGTFDYGIFAYVWVWVIILGHASAMGFNQSVVRFIPVYLDRGQHSLLRGILKSSRVISFIGSLVIASFSASMIYLFQDSLTEHNYYVMPFMIAMICLPLFALQDVQEGTAISFGWVNAALVPTYLIRPVLMIAFLGGAIALKFPITAVTAMWCMIGATLLSGLGQMLFLNRRINKIVPKSQKKDYKIKFWLMASFPLVLVDIFYNLQMYIDLTVLNFYVKPDQIAIYFAAAKTVGLTSFIHFAVGAAVGKNFSSYYEAGKHERMKEFVQQTTRWTFWPALGAAIFIITIGYPLLWLFGDEFTAGYPIMFILAIGILVHALAGQAEYLLNMLGYQYYVASVYLGTLFANLLFNIALVPLWGLKGAAISTSITLALQGLILSGLVKKLTGLDVFMKFGKDKSQT